jgi:uncharacterized protein YggE
VIFDISAQDAQDRDLKATYEQASSSLQKIINLAERNGLKKEDISSGVLTVRPVLRGWTYSLADEETAKQKAVAEAMKHAMGRANAALESKGQRVGALRFANLDDGCRRMNVYSMQEYNAMLTQTVDVSTGVGKSEARRAAPPPPVPQPEKISVPATPQCAFQIQWSLARGQTTHAELAPILDTTADTIRADVAAYAR